MLNDIIHQACKDRDSATILKNCLKTVFYFQISKKKCMKDKLRGKPFTYVKWDILSIF